MNQKQAVYSSRTADKFVVRLPDGFREKVAEAARANHRSMNSEIISRLQNSMLADGTMCEDDALAVSATLESTDTLWLPVPGQPVKVPASPDWFAVTGFVQVGDRLLANLSSLTTTDYTIQTEVWPKCEMKPLSIG